MISGGVKFFNKNKILEVDGGTIVSSVSGDILSEYAIDKNPITFWTSIGSTDLITEELICTFASQTFDRLLLQNHNFKHMNAKYWNGSTYVDFTNVIGLDGALSTFTLTSSNGTRWPVTAVDVAGIRDVAKGSVTRSGESSGDTITVNGVVFTAVAYGEQTPFTCVANTASALNGLYIDVYEGVAPGTPVRIWFSTAGVGTAPAVPGGGRLLNVDLVNNDADTVVATKIGAAVLDSTASVIFRAIVSSATVTFIHAKGGNMTNGSAGTSTFTLGSITDGQALTAGDFQVGINSAHTCAGLAAAVNSHASLTGIIEAFSEGAAVISFARVNAGDDTSYFEFDSVTTTRLRIQVLKTIVANAQKFISQIIFTEELGTLSGYPIIKSPEHSRNERVKTALSGKAIVQKGIDSFSVVLDFDRYPSNNAGDITLMMELFDSEDPFLVWLCGGRRGTTYFPHTARGFRLRDVYQVQTSGKFKPEYYKGIYTNPLGLEVKLLEHV